MRSRHVVLFSTIALGGLLAGCGGGSVAHELPETTPVLTAPPSGNTTTPSGTSTTDTTSTSTTTTATTGTGGTPVTPVAPATTTTTPSDTGGAAPPTETTAPTETTDPGAAGGADFNQFCEENPGAC